MNNNNMEDQRSYITHWISLLGQTTDDSEELKEMMAEKEVKDMLTAYNQQLKKMMKENDLLEKTLTETRGKLKKEEAERYKLSRENTQLHNEVVKAQSRAEKQLKKIEELNLIATLQADSSTSISGVGIEIHPETDEESIKNSIESLKGALNENDSGTKSIVEELAFSITKILKQKNQQITQLSQLIDHLQKENEIHKKYGEIYDDLTERFCENCKQYFLPKDNNDNACVFHPGKLKFYSCKGCGGDQYYTCCMRCTDCSKGCRKQKHVFSI